MKAKNERIMVCIINDVKDIVCQYVDVQYPSIVNRDKKRQRDQKKEVINHLWK